MLGGHGLIVVQGGGVEGNLFHHGDGAYGVGLSWAGGVVLGLPVAEELLEQGALPPSWRDLNLHMEVVDDEAWFMGAVF